MRARSEVAGDMPDVGDGRHPVVELVLDLRQLQRHLLGEMEELLQALQLGGVEHPQAGSPAHELTWARGKGEEDCIREHGGHPARGRVRARVRARVRGQGWIALPGSSTFTAEFI